MTNRECVINIFNSMTTDLCGDIEHALDEKDLLIAAYRQEVALRIYADLQETDYVIKNQKDSETLMNESLIIADKQAQKIAEEMRGKK